MFFVHVSPFADVGISSVLGAALVRHHFPSWNFSDWREAYYLSCLFHDIGTADFYLPQSKEEIDKKSKLSFEFKGGIVARYFILQHGGAEDLADAVCEVQFRLLLIMFFFILTDYVSSDD